MLIFILCGMLLIPAPPNFAKEQGGAGSGGKSDSSPPPRIIDSSRLAPQQQIMQNKKPQDIIEEESYGIPITEDTIPHYKENQAGSSILGFPEYIIGPTDELTITLWLKTKPEISKILVQQNGKISFSFIEDLQASGLTATQVDTTLTKRLEDYVKSPRIDVLVTGYNSKKVTLIGEIERMNTGSGYSGPGTYPLTGETRLLEIILKAGGYTQKANLSGVEITRKGKVYSVDLGRAVYQGDISQNIFLEGGDTINVPTLPIFQSEKTASKKVFVLGDVNYPGRYEFKKDISAVEAIALAGGIKNEADDAATRILRGKDVIPVNIRDILHKKKTELNVQIEDADIVFVPKLDIFEEDRLTKKRFYVAGGVTYPKLYEFNKKIGVMEAVAMAGGFTPEAFMNKSFIIRNEGKLPVDFVEFLKAPEKYAGLEMLDGDVLYIPKQNIISVACFGEVGRSGQVDLKGEKVTVSDAIAEAEGYTRDAVLSDVVVLRGDMRKPNVLRADLDRFLKDKDLSQNVTLEHGDVIYVPRSKIASISHFMIQLAPILANLMYPGLYRDMYSTGGGMRFDSGFPPSNPGASVSFPQVQP